MRRSIEGQKRDIQESLERFLRAHRTDGTLQEDFVTLRNDPREHNVVQIMVNGRRFIVTLRGGEERSVDIGVALRPGEVNRLKLVALGIPGSSVEVMVWDGDGQRVGRRDWLPVRSEWRHLLDRTRDSELSEGD